MEIKIINKEDSTFVVGVIDKKEDKVCPKEFCIEIDKEDRIIDILAEGGCQGNFEGMASFIRGMKINDVIERLKGITCGMKDTSCPDKIAEILRNI